MVDWTQLSLLVAHGSLIDIEMPSCLESIVSSLIHDAWAEG